MLQLILGGARSGKSRLAEKLATDTHMPVTYIATSQPLDGEMNARVAQHRARRPAEWALVEEPWPWRGCCRKTPPRAMPAGGLPDPLADQPADARRPRATERRTRSTAGLPGRVAREIIFVSNETGMGVVPLGELTRRYVDEAGWLHQALAERCQRVVLTVAGLPLTLKGTAL